MSVLSKQDRRDIAAEFMRSSREMFGKITKQDIFDATDALDDFLDGGGDVIKAKNAVPEKSAALTDFQITFLASLIYTKRNPSEPIDIVTDPRIDDVATILTDMGIKVDDTTALAERLLKALGV